MPTKQQIEQYMSGQERKSVYEASLHFKIEVQEVWKILQGG